MYINKLIFKSFIGVFSLDINYILEKILSLKSKIEIYINFSDNILLNNISIFNDLYDIYILFKKLLSKLSKHILLNNFFKIIIIGNANVGKSSLYNILLKFKRSVISNKYGTTRDFVSCRLSLNEYIFDLIDTAGFNNYNVSFLEKDSINMTLNLLKLSSIVLFIIDVNYIFINYYFFFQNRFFFDLNLFVLFNKIDLLEKIVKTIYVKNLIFLNISVVNNIGINLLIYELLRILNRVNNNLYIIDKRHLNLFIKINKYFNRCIKNIKYCIFFDILIEDLNLIDFFLSKLIGRNISNNLIYDIFSNFCIGK